MKYIYILVTALTYIYSTVFIGLLLFFFFSTFFWKTHRAYKNIHDLVTIHGKEVKRTKVTDTMKEEKANIHQWFTHMFRLIDQSEQWDRLEYGCCLVVDFVLKKNKFLFFVF